MDDEDLTADPLSSLLRDANGLVRRSATEPGRKRKLRPEVLDIQRTKDIDGVQPVRPLLPRDDFNLILSVGDYVPFFPPRSPSPALLRSIVNPLSTPHCAFSSGSNTKSTAHISPRKRNTSYHNRFPSHRSPHISLSTTSLLPRLGSRKRTHRKDSPNLRSTTRTKKHGAIQALTRRQQHGTLRQRSQRRGRNKHTRRTHSPMGEPSARRKPGRHRRIRMVVRQQRSQHRGQERRSHGMEHATRARDGPMARRRSRRHHDHQPRRQQRTTRKSDRTGSLGGDWQFERNRQCL